MTTTIKSPLRTIVIVTLIMVTAMLLLISSSGIALRIAKKNAPLIDAVMEIKYELSLYHLWLEELAQNDSKVDKEQVWQHLNKARWYANAMLEGGENPKGAFQALDAPILRSMILKTLGQIDRLEVVGLDRLDAMKINSLAGAKQDQIIDEVFTNTLRITDDVKTRIQHGILVQIRQFERLVYTLGTAIILIGLTGGILFFLIERQRNANYVLILESREQLQKKQALLRSLIDSVPDLIFFKDIESVYLGCNKAFETFTGRQENEIIGSTDLEPFDPELGKFFREKDRQMLSSGEAQRNDEWVDYPDGRRVLLDTLKTPYYGPEGEVLGLIGVSRDITARKEAELALHQSEQRLSLILNTLPHGIEENDTEGLITYSNIAHHRILGLEPNELIGRHIWDFQMDSKQQQELRDYLNYLIAEQPPPEPYVTHNLTGDGREVILEINWDYQRNAQGDISGFISVISDVTARIQSEQHLRQKETLLREAQAMAHVGKLGV